jgi:uncharacterized membrane protein
VTLLAAAEGPSLITFLGRFHPAVVHFPIALLGLAAFLEFVQILRRKAAFHPATFTLAAAATLSAVLATLLGLANAGGKKPDDALDAHRWAGIATTVIAMVMMLLVNKARSADGARVQFARGALFLSMILVSIAGHYGGVLVYGPDYYSSAWPWARAQDPLLLPSSSKVDFAKDIVPIIEESCFKCHGGGKGVKGELNLRTKALTWKGGTGGKVIVEGKPARSSFYTLLVTKDSDERMPKKSSPLPADQIEKVRRWIEDGAEWPDGFEFKKK